MRLQAYVQYLLHTLGSTQTWVSRRILASWRTGQTGLRFLTDHPGLSVMGSLVKVVPQPRPAESGTSFSCLTLHTCMDVDAGDMLVQVSAH